MGIVELSDDGTILTGLKVIKLVCYKHACLRWGEGLEIFGLLQFPTVSLTLGHLVYKPFDCVQWEKRPCCLARGHFDFVCLLRWGGVERKSTRLAEASRASDCDKAISNVLNFQRLRIYCNLICK